MPDITEGYIPVYLHANADISQLVYTSDTIPGKYFGNTLAYPGFLLKEQYNQGLHVFTADSLKTVKISFIHLPYAYEFKVSDTLLIAKTYMGIVKVSLSQLPLIRVVAFTQYESNKDVGAPRLPMQERDKSIFRNTNRSVYFECIDPAKGLVVDWKKGTLHKPKCHQ